MHRQKQQEKASPEARASQVTQNTQVLREIVSHGCRALGRLARRRTKHRRSLAKTTGMRASSARWSLHSTLHGSRHSLRCVRHGRERARDALDAANAITGLTHRAIADGSRPGGAIRVKSLPDGMVESGAGENAAMVAGGRPGSTTTRVPTLMRP